LLAPTTKQEPFLLCLTKTEQDHDTKRQEEARRLPPKGDEDKNLAI